jgi:hypothetical protein
MFSILSTNLWLLLATKEADLFRRHCASDSKNSFQYFATRDIFLGLRFSALDQGPVTIDKTLLLGYSFKTAK